LSTLITVGEELRVELGVVVVVVVEPPCEI
jgi:hypothetical protein